MTKRTYVEMVNVEDLTPAPFQPKDRTELRVIKDLIKSMSRDGFWTHKPITITLDNQIADGHRRWTAAKTLGIKKVPCLRTAQNVDTAWVAANDTARRISGKEWVEAYAAGLQANGATNAVGRRINYYTDKYGKELIDFLAENGKSTGSIARAESICRYLGWNQNGDVSKVVRWMIKHEMVLKARLALEERFPKDLWASKINNDEPIEFVHDIQ